MPWPRPLLPLLLLLFAVLDHVAPFVVVVVPTIPNQKQQPALLRTAATAGAAGDSDGSTPSQKQHSTLSATAGVEEGESDPAMLLLLERLGPRLGDVFRLVPRTARVVADVGCDHFSLGLALALDGGSHRPALARVIGVDKAMKPLEQARRNVKRVQTGLQGESVVEVNGRAVELRLGDGLKALRGGDAVDTVAIAGMGTRNIVEVLGAPAVEEVLRGVKHLVLQVRVWGCLFTDPL